MYHSSINLNGRTKGTTGKKTNPQVSGKPYFAT